MKIGFTGTRSGMSDRQKELVMRELSVIVAHEKDEVFFFHGGCVGADMDFHFFSKEFRELKDETKKIEIHVYQGHSAKNPNDHSLRGDYRDADIIYPSKTYFERNRSIVNDCDLLIATPYNDNQQGGTWYTINYAKKVGKRIIILPR